jgi:diguanylate cyclase (GGDEF)-like protein
MAVVVVMTASRALVPADSTAGMLIVSCSPLLTIAAILVGIRIHRPTHTVPWLLLVAALIANMAGNISYGVDLADGQVSYPSVADGFWLAGYAVELAGVMLLVNGMSWRRDRAGIMDTLMVTCGLGLGVWLVFLQDLIEPAMPLGTRLVTIAYPVAVMLMLAGVIRMCTSSARRSAAFWQLTAALSLQGALQGFYLWQNAHGGDITDLAPFFMLYSLLFGGAALHPSMATLDGDDNARPDAHATPMRVILIGWAGLLCPMLMIADGILGDAQVDWVAGSVCSIAVVMLVNIRIIGLIRTVQNQADRLESIAYLDGLTGIPNRRAWDAELERSLAVARRTGETVVVGLIDLDFFKRYNDRLGHPAGDDLLRSAGAVWQEQLRAGDMIARYGGEEFGLILHCRLREAAAVMERLREVTPDGQTFSAGLAQWTGDETAERLTSRVDWALYTAKKEGRDQFAVTGHPARTDLQADFLAGAGDGGR